MSRSLNTNKARARELRGDTCDRGRRSNWRATRSWATTWRLNGKCSCSAPETEVYFRERKRLLKCQKKGCPGSWLLAGPACAEEIEQFFAHGCRLSSAFAFKEMGGIRRTNRHETPDMLGKRFNFYS